MIAFIGDLAFNGLISTDSSNNAKRFEIISRQFNSNDLVFANLEMPIIDKEEFNEYKSVIHFADQQVTKEILKMLNIGCLSLANNHIFDCKISGLKATIKLLDQLGIHHTGAGWREEHINPVNITYQNKKIAFIAYVDESTNPKTEKYKDLYINYLHRDKIIEDIKSIRSSVDFLVCSLHWGNDYSNFFSKEQRTIAYEIINSGADLIMGHHPHTVQSFEYYNDKLIFYSLGQLCFGDFIWENKIRSLKRKTKKGIIVKLDLSRPSNIDLISTFEKKANYIDITRKNLFKKLSRLLVVNNVYHKYSVIRMAIRFKETFIDRIFEFLFGYYRNPISDTFNKNNYKKLSYLVRDFRKKT